MECLIRRLAPTPRSGRGRFATPTERDPDACQSGVVFLPLEERKRRPRESLELVDVRRREFSRASGGDDDGECLPDAVAGCRARRPLLGDRRCAPGGTCCTPRDRARGGRRDGAAGSAREPARGAGLRRADRPRVQSARRPAAASRAPARSASSGSGIPELGLVASRLLEVVADDLVQLDELGAALVQPVGEALVQLGARRPSAARRRPRRGSAGAGSGRRRRPAAGCGRAGSAPCGREPRVAASTCRVLGRAPARRRGGRARPRPRRARARARSGVLELVEAGGEQRLQGRRHDRRSRRSSAAIATISVRKSGLPPAA